MGQPLPDLVQEYAPVLVPIGVVLGAAITILSQQVIAVTERRADRRWRREERRTEAYLTAIAVLLKRPEQPLGTYAPGEDVRSYWAAYEPWTREVQGALAPLYAFADQDVFDYVSSFPWITRASLGSISDDLGKLTRLQEDGRDGEAHRLNVHINKRTIEIDMRCDRLLDLLRERLQADA